jgi:hypothetical protein
MSPSPHGDFLVVMLSTLVGIRTGPLIVRFLPLAPVTRSRQTAHRSNEHGQSDSISVAEIKKPSSGNGTGPVGARVPFSRFLTFLEVRVMRILCCTSGMPPSNPALPDFIGGAYATSAAAISLVGGEEAAEG